MTASGVGASDPKFAHVQRLFAGLRAGETRALARAVSLVEDDAAEAVTLLDACRESLAGAERVLRIGITGPPGAGKSTLVDALARELRAQGRRVGIVAVDPSSPFTGGAILGDRIRLGEFAADAGVYMRSMATRGHLGGLAKATDDVLTVIEASGKDVLLIETTGVGQGEIEVVGLADVVAVVLVPGMGDSIQSLKAGVLEIASVYVLNKADREGIERLEQEIQGLLVLSAVVAPAGVKADAPPILRTVATTGAGVADLLAAMDAAPRNSARKSAVRLGAGAVPDARVVLDARPVMDASPVLDHLGIAVRSLDASQRLYAALGMAVSGVEEIASERVRVAMLSAGESRIELLEPTESDSAVGRFLAKRGEGLHHIALRVPDLAATVAKLKLQGVRLVSETIQIGAGGHRYVFVHPTSANGVLLELVESAYEGERS